MATKLPPWIKVSATLIKDPKIREVARRCRVWPVTVAGAWATLLGNVKLTTKETGEIEVGKSYAADLADLSGWPVERADEWASALWQEKLIEVRREDGQMRWFVVQWMKWYESDLNRQENGRERTDRYRTNKTIRETAEALGNRSSRISNVTTYANGRPPPIRNASHLTIVTRHDDSGDGVRVEETRAEQTVVTTPATNSEPVGDLSGATSAPGSKPKRRTKAQQNQDEYDAEMAEATKPGAAERNEQMIRDGTCPPVTEFMHYVSHKAGLRYTPSAFDRGKLVAAKNDRIPIADIAEVFIAVAGTPQRWGNRWHRDNVSAWNAIKWLPAFQIEMQRREGRNGKTGNGAGALADGGTGAATGPSTRTDRHAADAAGRGARIIQERLERRAREAGDGADEPAEPRGTETDG